MVANGFKFAAGVFLFFVALVGGMVALSAVLAAFLNAVGA